MTYSYAFDAVGPRSTQPSSVVSTTPCTIRNEPYEFSATWIVTEDPTVMPNMQILVDESPAGENASPILVIGSGPFRFDFGACAPLLVTPEACTPISQRIQILGTNQILPFQLFEFPFMSQMVGWCHVPPRRSTHRRRYRGAGRDDPLPRPAPAAQARAPARRRSSSRRRPRSLAPEAARRLRRAGQTRTRSGRRRADAAHRPPARERRTSHQEEALRRLRRIAPAASLLPPAEAACHRRRSDPLRGFTLHADVCIAQGATDRLEQLARYAARPPIVEDRLSLSADGTHVIYRFRRPFRDGTTHVVLSCQEFVARLAALIPRFRARVGTYCRVSVLLTRQLYYPSLDTGHRRFRPVIESADTSTLRIAFLGLDLVRTPPLPIPPFGWLQLRPATAVFLPPVTLLPGVRTAFRGIAIPDDPTLVGQVVRAQAIVAGVGGPPSMHLTGLIERAIGR